MEVKERLAELMLLQGALSAGWNSLKGHLEKRKAELVVGLISHDDEQMRGRIKELDDLLGLPERLQREAEGLTAPQQEEGELP
jgi:hypothetical protein